MQKIIIKNFGAVKDAEIEIKPILVLIGEQASGKSTIAKLIYFFKSLRDELFNRAYNVKYDFDVTTELTNVAELKFSNFFGAIAYASTSNFEITYYYDVEKNKYIKISHKNSIGLQLGFSDFFLTKELKKKASQIKNALQADILPTKVHEKIAFEQNQHRYIQNLSAFVNNTFSSNHNSSLFVIAGRNATVSYSDLFEKYLFASLKNKIEEAKKQNSNNDKQTIDETLMLSFIERVSQIKSLFNKYGGNFENLKSAYAKNNDEINKVIAKINNILKGNYISDNSGEKIILNEENKQFVFLHNASSGQQEAIRILQDIFLVLLERDKAFRIIEEPEAHLFPVAQKQLIELLAYYANQGNELIITTHSPYVLTVFNNLLFANRVVTKNENAESQVSKIIEKDIRLKQNDFAAYSLTSMLNEAQEVYCEDILNKKTGLINQNYLDTVSELLSNDFNNLYSIHAKSFARK